MIYAVIDTNVLVSALLSRNPYSATVLVVNAISKTGICPLYNYEIITEYCQYAPTILNLGCRNPMPSRNKESLRA